MEERIGLPMTKYMGKGDGFNKVQIIPRELPGFIVKYSDRLYISVVASQQHCILILSNSVYVYVGCMDSENNPYKCL